MKELVFTAGLMATVVAIPMGSGARAQGELDPIERRVAAFVARAAGPVVLDPQSFPDMDPPDLETAGRIYNALEGFYFDLDREAEALRAEIERLEHHAPHFVPRLLSLRIELRRALYDSRDRTLEALPRALSNEFRERVEQVVRWDQQQLRCRAARDFQRLRRLDPQAAHAHAAWLSNVDPARCVSP